MIAINLLEGPHPAVVPRKERYELPALFLDNREPLPAVFVEPKNVLPRPGVRTVSAR
jgi:hypothetical protein